MSISSWLSRKRRFKPRRSNTVLHHPAGREAAQRGSMIITITSVILAVLSLPFIVYAGERTVRSLPRPAFVRSFSDSMVRKPKKPVLADSDEEAEERDDGSPEMLSRTLTTPTLRRMATDFSRADTGFSVSSGETYIRGMPLERLGLD